MISVIVPVYKVEKYINRCVESILSQSFRDFELILVDDGSPDDCPEICDRYAAKYDNVTALHKENGGLSDARNAGTAVAKGDLVTFIDSDDYVSCDYLETLMGLKEKYVAEVCVGGILPFAEGTEPKPDNDDSDCVFDPEQALSHMLYQDGMDTSACCILMPMAFAKKYPFPVGRYHEDEFTTYNYYASAEKTAVSRKKIYFYMQRESSIMHSLGKDSMDEIEAADNLVAYCEANFPSVVSAARSKKFSDYCQVLLKTKGLKETDPGVYDKICSYLRSAKAEMLTDKNTRLKNKAAALALYLGPGCLFFLNRLKGGK
ncbi:MAG: glycosyltransferase family 2 protein [Firmicutes bacterium]|nr:glycosyltransferase family 2 protein [Bacillota bacterium]